VSQEQRFRAIKEKRGVYTRGEGRITSRGIRRVVTPEDQNYVQACGLSESEKKYYTPRSLGKEGGCLKNRGKKTKGRQYKSIHWKCESGPSVANCRDKGSTPHSSTEEFRYVNRTKRRGAEWERR